MRPARNNGGLIAVLVTLIVVGGCQPRSTAVPTEFLGVWETVNVRYADRFFEISPTSVTFGVGHGSTETYSIVAVERGGERDPALHTISYRNRAGQEGRLNFYYERRDAGVIRFKHQRDIPWTKGRS
ncbi:MAG TPA: hypothetical protein VLG10_15570 [Methylomirabilota bacterium]|nr:hypothetical protein [Methylomirabilota bacterium]